MKRFRLAAAVCLLACGAVHAQAPASAAPSAAAAQPVVAPAAPTAPADPFPPANPKYFDTPSPSIETVNAFLKALWGYDTTRLWRVMAIQATRAPNVAKVVVFVSDTSANAKVASTVFYTTPDGKFALAEGVGVVPFGPNPFGELRTMLQQRADGASRGAPGKALELVEFADLQCPHCKDAQAIMDQLVKDFPNAHVVFQLYPLVDIHPSAFKAAAYGVCVQRQSNDAFFKYAAAVFDTQEALAPPAEDTVLKAAVTRAGLDPKAISACSETQATKDTVNADIKLAVEAGIDQTPLLSVNGRTLPVTQIPYEQIKQIVLYQAAMDHVPTGAAPDVVAPQGPAPAK
ncbi:MAG: DsbA family protein [Acidobacteriota bacterium]|nr:DsbA family protein [Acidobacteriota bacterium]